MKIEITKYDPVKYEIDIDFPYYYIHDLYSDYGDSVIYGKITSDKKEVTIHEDIEFNGHKTYKIGVDSMSDSYFDSEHKSNKKEFECVKQKALDFLNDF